MNNYAIYPRVVPPSVIVSTEARDSGPLRIHAETAAPAGPGPFPAVLVHPAGGERATELRGVITDLAMHGYLAVAVDYERLIEGKYRRTLFPFREEADLMRAVALLEADPRADRARVALMGFSQGGVFSLLIAAEVPQAAGVVAYSRVTDYAGWLDDPRYGAGKRLVFHFIRKRFYEQSGARNQDEFHRMLRRASPLRQAERIRVPVLLVHGRRDRSAPVAESQRLAERLEALQRDVTLREVPDAGHVFNFLDKDAQKARPAWDETVRWLDAHVRSPVRTAVLR